MAVCNIFSPLSNPTGNFLMFSNYVDDMNRYRVQDSLYRVSASKFLAVDVDFDYVKTTSGITDAGAADLNRGIPQLFQNMYENWIAFSKNNPDLGLELYKNIVSAGLGDQTGVDDIDETNISENEYRKRLFWSFLYRCGFIKPVSSGSEISNIKYEGKTSLETYDNHSGEGYGELICHIPSESTVKEYHIDFDTFQKNQVNIVADGNPLQSFNHAYIEGYTDSTPVSGVLVQRDKLMTATRNSNVYSIVDPEKSSSDSTSYKFNMVIVFYDIKQDGINIESDIPMGVYFVGNFNESGDTQMSNERAIYIQNKDIFGASTTYSLRICTRYTVNPNRYGVDTDIEVSPEDQTNLSILLSKMSDNIDTMNKVLETAHAGNAVNKELYAIFKSGQVNVPYIKVIDGVSYWFVNGKLISQIAFEEIGPDTISAEFNKMTSVWNGDYWKVPSHLGGDHGPISGPVIPPEIGDDIIQEVDPDIKPLDKLS